VQLRRGRDREDLRKGRDLRSASMDQASREEQRDSGFYPAGPSVSPETDLCPVENRGMEATDVEVVVADAGAGEGTGSSAMTAPIQPTKKIIEDHEVSHLPFRNWCAACVRGGGKSVHHRSLDKQETVLTFSIDYGFFGSPGETPLKTVAGEDLPVLVGYDRKAKAVFAHPVLREGLQKEGHVCEYPVKVIVKDSNRLGYKKVNGKSDQENAILAVCNAVEVLW
jgi:hypothetical protein